MPVLRAQKGLQFGAFPSAVRLRLAVIAGLSLSSWVSALALGAFSQLKPMPTEPLVLIFGVVYGLALVGACVMANVSPRLFGATRGARKDDLPEVIYL